MHLALSFLVDLQQALVIRLRADQGLREGFVFGVEEIVLVLVLPKFVLQCMVLGFHLLEPLERVFALEVVPWCRGRGIGLGLDEHVEDSG